jgi:hypothetical protein
MPATPAWGNQPRNKDANEVTFLMRQLTRSTKNMAKALKYSAPRRSCATTRRRRCCAPITFAHFSSSAMSFPKSAGDAATTVLSRPASRALILGSAMPALISLLSFFEQHSCSSHVDVPPVDRHARQADDSAMRSEERPIR